MAFEKLQKSNVNDYITCWNEVLSDCEERLLFYIEIGKI